jgi:hypothetical protein
MTEEREGELRAIRDLLRRVVDELDAFLDELEGLKSIRDPAARGDALLRLLERRVPDLRIVTEGNGGDSRGKKV